MQAEGTGADALVCLYCGAEAEAKPPYEVVRCDCRSAGANRGAASSRERDVPPFVRQAA